MDGIERAAVGFMDTLIDTLHAHVMSGQEEQSSVVVVDLFKPVPSPTYWPTTVSPSPIAGPSLHKVF